VEDSLMGINKDDQQTEEKKPWKSSRTYFAFEEGESMGEWIARINHDLDNGKMPKQLFEDKG